MNSCLKLILQIVGLTAISRALFAADATPYTSYATNTYVPSAYPASNSISSSSSNAVVMALNGQVFLLREMLEDHQKKAADFAQRNQTEKAKWESDLVNELHEKSAHLQKSIDRAALSWSGTNDPKAAATDLDDQLIFVSTVEARMDALRQDLSAAIDKAAFCQCR